MVGAGRLLSPCTPWLMLSPEIDFVSGGKVDRFYSPLSKELYKLNRKTSFQVPDDSKCVGSIRRGWISFMDQTNSKIYITNPFIESSQVPVTIQLPSLQTLPWVLGIKRKPDSSLVDRFIIASTYFDMSDPEFRSKGHLFHTPEHLSDSIVQTEMSIGDPYSNDCIVMINSYYYRQLAFCRPARDHAWFPLHSSGAGHRMIYSQKENLFYLDNLNTSIESFHIKNHLHNPVPTRASRFTYPLGSRPRDLGRTRLSYLVVDDSLPDIDTHLTLVVRSVNENEKTLSFQVFTVNMRERTLEAIESIGDRAIFVGKGHPFSLSTIEFPGLKPNSIYFTNDLYIKEETGIYSLENNSITSCHPSCSISSSSFIWVAPP